jgi:hemimethylated DNA binding protein
VQIRNTGTQALPHGTAQPFYHCLVDIRDRPEAQVSYVAQDNVQLLEPEVAAAPQADVERLVLHPLLTRYFSAYRVDAGCYVPGARLMTQAAGGAAAAAAAAGGEVPSVPSGRGAASGSGKSKSPRVSSVAA